MSRKQIHYMDEEGQAFSDFITTCLNFENETAGISSKIHSLKDTKTSYDFYSEKGISGITDKSVLIIIKYGNNIKSIDNIVKSHKNYNRAKELVIIGLWAEPENQDSGVIIKGKEYVKYLAGKYPALFWCFASANEENSKIELSDDGKRVILKTKVLGLEDYPVELGVEAIDDISEANKHEFIRRSQSAMPAVITGNGISIPFGSDSWNNLTLILFDYLKPFYISDDDRVAEAIGNTNYSMNSLSMYMLDDKSLSKALHECIYRKYLKDKMHTEHTLLHALAEAKVKNPAMPILTYNYDCFIENDIKQYHPEVTIKSVHSARGENKSSEPMIKHVHGMVTNSSNPKQMNIVLSADQYYNAYKGKTWVYRSQYNVLSNNTCLFVGSSMSDLYQMSVVRDVKESFEKGISHRLWKCFALLCLNGMNAKDKISVINYYMSKGVYVIFTNEYDELPSVLKSLL